MQYFALGERAEEGALAYLSDYYGEFGAGIAAAVPKTPEALHEAMKSFEAIGTDELIFDPTIGELEQVELLAEAVL